MTQVLMPSTGGRSRHDLTNRVFGSWTVLRPAPSKNGNTHWWCRCVCSEKEIAVATQSLVRRRSSSCRCQTFHEEHGQARCGKKTKKYRTWCKLIDRCTNPNSRAYAACVGKLHPEWTESFLVFNQDVTDPPDVVYCQFRRLDPAGRFEPGNVGWKIYRQPIIPIPIRIHPA